VDQPAPREAARQTRAEQNASSGRRLHRALVDLVAEQGYDATSAAEIGIRAGFSRAMVHARFGAKDALLDELMRTEFEQRILGGVDDGLTGLQQVLAIVERIDRLADDDEQFLKAMFILAFEAVRGSAAVRPRIIRWLEVVEADVAGAMATGQNDGSIRVDVQASDAARECLMYGCGVCYTWIVLPKIDLHEELARYRARIVANYAAPKRKRR
jgi:AcrR family transcriptional regulator